MKLSLTLSLLLGMATLFQGCGTTEDPEQPAAANTTTIKGSATLATIVSNDSTVCLDLNSNESCDVDEPTTQTNQAGQYSLTIEGSLKDGTSIIVHDGVNLLPPAVGEQKNLKFIKSYQNEETTQNINIFSTLVVTEMENNPSETYADAVENIRIQYFGSSTNCAGLTAEDVLKNPIGTDAQLLKCMNALQAITYDKNASYIQTSPARAAQNDSIDGYIDTNSTYYDDLYTSLESYLEDFYAWWDEFWADEPATEPQPPIIEEPVTVEPKLVEIQRDDLNGIWFIIDASGDRTCSDIRSNNDIAVTEADGKTTGLSLTYDNTKKTMLLKLGFFTADTIKFDKYYDNETFTGNYESDGETLKGYKVDTLDSCKYDADKLGLK